MEKYLITGALPYANGKLHVGHVAGAYLPADIFTRYLKLKEKDVIFICGTDEHGAPISIRAEAENTTPRALVDFYHDSIQKSFDGLHIEFTNFSGTARKPHSDLSQKFFLNLLAKGYINTKSTKQMYCPNDKRFLPDRYVEGFCPHCGAAGARGDQCDACGKLIDATTLKEPKCKICNNEPIIKETKHWFLDLPKFSEQLKSWLQTKTTWKDNVHKFILSWIEEGLIERAITRDINWGVPVPLEDTEGKVLYVWFDAPIGYISSTIEWSERIGDPERWKDYWFNKETKMYHFIGKDNIPFHTIIWPAMLMGQEENYVLPEDVPANEYLNLEGEKISTSRNWAIWVDEFLQYFDGEFLRYVLAANAPETKDSDFSWKDFQSRINNELANVLGNLANRVLLFANKHFTGTIPVPQIISGEGKAVLASIHEMVKEVEQNYTEFQVRKNTKLIMDIARLGNRYFDESKPWVTVKEQKEITIETIYICAELLRIVSILYTPILPTSMKKLRAMMGINTAPLWSDIQNQIQTPLPLCDITPLYRKIEDQEIEQQLSLLNAKSKKNEVLEKEEFRIKEEIEFEDFEKMDLRIVEILTAIKVEKSKKLLKLCVQLDSQKIDVISGIAEHYKPEDLIGKKVVMLLNLKPRKIMGQESKGMILAAEKDGSLCLLSSISDIAAGAKIH